MYNWLKFKTEFLKFIRETTGLFTLLNDTSFPYFNLEQFLKRQSEGRPLSNTQIEMLMALSCFIDTQEAFGNITIDIFPIHVKQYIRILIEKNLLQINPFNNLKKGFMTEEVLEAVAAAAA